MPRSAAAPALRDLRPVFAALGDETRLRIVARLCEEGPLSATRLADAAGVSRQAVAKHLRVLAGAALASDARAGRESLWRLEPSALAAARAALEAISLEWDARVERLRRMVDRPRSRSIAAHARRSTPAR